MAWRQPDSAQPMPITEGNGATAHAVGLQLQARRPGLSRHVVRSRRAAGIPSRRISHGGSGQPMTAGRAGDHTRRAQHQARRGTPEQVWRGPVGMVAQSLDVAAHPDIYRGALGRVCTSSTASKAGSVPSYSLARLRRPAYIGWPGLGVNPARAIAPSRTQHTQTD